MVWANEIVPPTYDAAHHTATGTDSKGNVVHLEGLPRTQKGMQPPELIAAMSPEQRAIAEKKLKRKLDIRLLPMLILMYSMLYAAPI